MTEKGIAKTWTPELEKHFSKVLDMKLPFVQREFITSIRDLLKYDGRSKAARKARARRRLRLAFSSDEELLELATQELLFFKDSTPPEEKLKELKEVRDTIKQRGIKKSEL